MTRQWAREFLLYSSKVHHVGQMINRANDGRQRPQISSNAIFAVMLLGFVHRMVSMEELGREIGKGRYRRVIPRQEKLPSHDTVRRALCKWNLDSLQASHDQFVAKFKALKGPAKGSIDGWRVAAIDGVELFSTVGHCCSDCQTRHHRDSGVTEYFHRAVFMQKVGGDPRVIYGALTLGGKDGSDKAEGESVGTRRLIEHVRRHAGHVADILTMDALFAKAPVVHAALDAHMDVVIRMKEERRSVMKDAKGLFDAREPDAKWTEKDSEGNRVTVLAWDEEKLESWPQVRVPIRIVKVVRTTEKSVLRGNQNETQVESVERWMATTSTRSAVSTRTVAKITAARWDIENNGFHDLKTYWHMDHAFVHDPVAIQAWLGILILAVNLVYTFVYEHLHHFRKWNIPLGDVIQEIKEQMRWGHMPREKVLWNTA